MTGSLMRAMRVHEWNTPPRLEEIGKPVAGDGETLVQVEAAAVSHLDRTIAGGNFGIKPELPYVGGVEGCGIVIESDRLPPGARVMLRGGGLGMKRNGTWAEFVAIATRRLTVLPEGMSPLLGATYFVPVTTAAVALTSVGRLGAWNVDNVSDPHDETVVVAGAAGAVGSIVTQMARRRGAQVLGLVRDESQAARLPNGVEAVLSHDQVAINELAKDRPATLLIDTLGGQELASRMGWVRSGGRAVLIGYVAGANASFDLPNWLLQDVSLLPVNMISRDKEAKAIAEDFVPLLISGELVLEVEEFEFGQVGRAIERLGTGGLHGRAVIRTGGTPQ